MCESFYGFNMIHVDAIPSQSREESLVVGSMTFPSITKFEHVDWMLWREAQRALKDLEKGHYFLALFDNIVVS